MIGMDEHGISDAYHDIFGQLRVTSEETRRALRDAMGVGSRPAPPARVRVIRAGANEELGHGELHLEDGGHHRHSGGVLPPDLPLGYHRFEADDAEPLRLIVAPRRCVLPPDLRGWGWAVQLYAARSAASWGIGDLADLRALCGWARGLGARMLLVNPLAAVAPVFSQQASPYYPSSRCYRNPLYLRVEEVPGAESLPGLAELAAAGRALNADRRIDRDAVLRLKLRALEPLWERFPGDPRFDRYRAAEGTPLASFAAYCVLAERHGADWRRWAEELRHPAAAGVQRVAREEARRVGFHAWLQWLLDEQLARADREGVLLMQDLPIGVDPGGADAWTWQDTLADGASVGAPPDRYSADGQDWGLPPLVPARLRAAAYEPFIHTVRAALRHSGGLRIDHVMGLFRLFWIPRGGRPADGAYVYYPADDLLGVLALESHREDAVIVGEDLGTVEAGVREQLAEHAVLSYRVMWFEDRRPRELPELALAAVTTHDLPTVAGLWTGSDAAEERALGRTVNDAETARVRGRLAEMAGLRDDSPLEEVIVGAHRLLAEAPSLLVTATLEDALATQERPNVPATCTERPNWSLALPRPLEELMQAPLARRIAAALTR